MSDASRKGRLHGRRTARGDQHGSHTCPESVRRGADNGAASLTLADVAKIRVAYPKMTQTQLAKRHRVSQITISRVVRRVTYKAD